MEEVVAGIFSSRGYRVQRNVRLTGVSGVSHEIDVLATYETPLGEVRVAVECKRHASPVMKDAVMKLRDEIQDLGIEKGIIVSTSGFTEGAIRYAKSTNIELWDLPKLKSLLREQARERAEFEEYEGIALRRLYSETRPRELLITDFRYFVREVKRGRELQISYTVVNRSDRVIHAARARHILYDEAWHPLVSKEKVLRDLFPGPNTFSVKIVSPPVGGKCVFLNVTIIASGEKLLERTFEIKISRCFIATAAFGTPMAAELCILRFYRDTVLLKNSLGRLLVRTYYMVSPPIARVVARSEALRWVVRQVLKPVIALIKRRYGLDQVAREA